MKKTMLVVVIEPDKPARKETIGSDLKSMQEVVGGYIEVVPFSIDSFPKSKFLLVLNEEGMILRLPINYLVKDETIRVAGTAFICKSHRDEMIGLTEEEADHIIHSFYRKEEADE